MREGVGDNEEVRVRRKWIGGEASVGEKGEAREGGKG